VATITIGWDSSVDADGNVSARQVRRSVTGRTKKEVLARLREAQHLTEQGITVPPMTLSLGSMLDRWLDDVLPGAVSRVTEWQYRDVVRIYIKPRIGRIASRSSRRVTSRGCCETWSNRPRRARTGMPPIPVDSPAPSCGGQCGGPRQKDSSHAIPRIPRLDRALDFESSKSLVPHRLASPGGHSTSPRHLTLSDPVPPLVSSSMRTHATMC
jgi:hypothetical protein